MKRSFLAGNFICSEAQSSSLKRFRRNDFFFFFWHAGTLRQWKWQITKDNAFELASCSKIILQFAVKTCAMCSAFKLLFKQLLDRTAHFINTAVICSLAYSDGEDEQREFSAFPPLLICYFSESQKSWQIHLKREGETETGKPR